MGRGGSQPARTGGRADVAASNIHSVLAVHDGLLVAERYYAGTDRSIYSLWGSHRAFGAAHLHDMRSVGKSVLGLVYGILSARGEVSAPETPLAALYPQCAGQDGPSGPLRVRHLLTMSMGLAWEERRLQDHRHGVVRTLLSGRAPDDRAGRLLRRHGGLAGWPPTR